MLAILKLCNGEEKIGGKTKVCENSKGPAWGKKIKLQNKVRAKEPE